MGERSEGRSLLRVATIGGSLAIATEVRTGSVLGGRHEGEGSQADGEFHYLVMEIYYYKVF